VRVRVDEAGGDHLAGGIDHDVAAGRREIADLSDAICAHADVGRVGRGAAAVDDAGVADQQIEMLRHLHLII